MTTEEAIAAYMARRETVKVLLRKIEKRQKELHDELSAADAELATFLGVVHTESGGDDKSPQ